MKKYKDTIANQKQNKLHLEDRKFLQSIKEATHGSVTTEEQKTADRNGDNKWKKQKRKKTSRRI